MQKKHIIFMGMKHSGKSTLGEKTGKTFQKPFYDLDDVISQISSEKNATAREIYRKNGAEVFQQLEWEAANKILANPLTNQQFVIALGGGTIDNLRTMDLLKANGYLIYLKEDADVLYKRIIKNGIPAFFNVDNDPYDEFLRLYKERTAKYEKNADLIISLQKRDIEAAAVFIGKCLIENNYVW